MLNRTVWPHQKTAGWRIYQKSIRFEKLKLREKLLNNLQPSSSPRPRPRRRRHHSVGCSIVEKSVTIQQHIRYKIHVYIKW